MPSNDYQRFGEVYGHPTGNPFIGGVLQPPVGDSHLRHPREQQSEPEPISMIDEEEFARKFRDIALFADQDDLEEDAALLHATLGSRRKSDQYIHSKTSYADDCNAGFNSKLIDTSQLASVMSTPRPGRLSSAPGSGSGSHPSTPSFGSSLGGKSFLDDDWLLNRVEHDSNMAQVAAGLVRPRSAVSRPRTPLQSNGNNGSLAFRSLNDSKKGSPSVGERHVDPIPPPSDYVCKLCNVSGHWLKDCHLFEPRQSTGGKGAFGGLRCGSTSTANGRTPKPPSNYVCRLCGVSGHWIEHCEMFQPRQQTSPASSGKEANEGSASVGGKRTMSHPSFRSIPPPPGYVCNLCEQPGHWLQQCTLFEPMNTLGPKCPIRKERR